jgi:NhaP-type Na+/H+ or K+/H+ antiporter
MHATIRIAQAQMMILPRILSLLTLIATVPYALADDDGETTTNDDIIENEEEELEPATAVLFPPFAVTIGFLVFYVLSRYMKALPYTVTMFFMGTLMGIAVAVGDSSNQIHQTILQWININSEVLLLVFLPGLVFKDAFGQNVHLFAYAFWQIFVFAFPIVLAGTVLTALIGYYVFPYGWSFNLSMTFGSILAATDPVAVAALLDEVGAPPRLKVHVGGESLLDDGSAIVFFTIFSARYFFELGYPGLGEEVDLAKGIGLFCRKALGGFAAGLLFGVFLLIVLFMLDRKFNREENVVQVTTVLGMTYLCYYVSDYIWETSGVIATLTAGLLVKLMGHAMVNDPKLLEDFLALVEHLLNTILFTLGGVVWGAVIADGEKQGVWKAREWGYLILLFVLLTAIRAVQFTVAYPITVRIGLKTNWKETLFQIYGGLRGAVGIALAISLDNTVAQVTGGLNETPEEIHTQTVFAMVGGIAFMSLMINATTAGPLLRKLGLAASTETRQRIVHAYEMRFVAVSVKHMVRLLTQEQYQCVNFALVKHHIPYLADLTKTQLSKAVEADKDTTPTNEYNPPYLKRILPYLEDNKDEAPEEAAIDEAPDTAVGDTAGDSIEARAEQHHVRNRKKLFSVTNACPSMYGGGSLSAQ